MIKEKRTTPVTGVISDQPNQKFQTDVSQTQTKTYTITVEIYTKTKKSEIQ